MKKDLGIIFGLFAVVIVLLVFAGPFISTSFFGQKESTNSAVIAQKFTDITIRDLTVKAEVVQSEMSQKKGLSGRDSLELNQGMLFVFDKSSIYPFWMKDMKFAIDIIWIDESKKVVHIAENAPTEPGKKDSELFRYVPINNARYVLEINAGLANLHHIQIGDTANFQSP